jgi:phage shock protein A
MFDRNRLAGILRGPLGDAHDLANEVVALMGAKRAAEDQLRTLGAEAALWREQAAEAVAERLDLARQLSDVLAQVPKTRRGQFAGVSERVEELLAGAA